MEKTNEAMNSEVPQTIETVQGTATFVKTEFEDADGKWNDSYFTYNGYYVIHQGFRHHVYLVGKKRKLIVRSFKVWKDEKRASTRYYNENVVVDEKNRIDSEVRRLKEQIDCLLQIKAKVKRIKLDVSEQKYIKWYEECSKEAEMKGLQLVIDDDAMRG